jgi:type IV pilus assembly protein PilM
MPVGLFEFQPEYILGVRISRPFRRVARVAVGDLDEGVISAIPGRPNILKPEEVRGMIVAMAKVLGSSKGPFGLLIPDAAVRVSILSFDTLPADRKEQESLIRWKMKPLLAFPLEEARLSFEVTPKQSGGVEVIAVAVRNSVVEEYESMMDALNGDVRLVLPSSAALLPLLSEDRVEGELLLHVSPSMLTAVVVSGRQIRMWRNQSMNGKSPEERLAAVAEEAARTLAASHDHLGLEISGIRLCARPSVPEGWAVELGRTLLRAVGSLAPDPLAVGIRLSAEERELLREFGATASGIVANAA